MRWCVSSFLVCLCLVLLSLNAVVVSASNSYGTMFQSYLCPYATSIALYASAPNSLYLTCYGSGMLRVTSTGSLGGYSSNTNYQCHGATSIAVNPWTGVTYGACALSGIMSWDPTTLVATTLATPSQCLYPSSVAVNQYTNTVYAACGLGGGVISIVGTSAPTTVLTPAQCPTATAVATDPLGSVAYAACTGVGILLLRTGFSPLTLAGTDVCASPQSLTVHPSADVVYAVCAPSAGKPASLLTIIGDTVQSYPLGSCSDPRSVAVDIYGDQIYVACGSSGGVVALDPVSTILTPVVPPAACHTATGVVASTGSPNYVYVACSSPYADTGAAATAFAYNYPPAVIGIDVKTTVLATTAQCPNAWELAVDTYQNIAYASCGYGYGILGASGNTYTSTFVVNTTYCNDPVGMATNPNTNTLYVGCNSPGGISAVTNPNTYGTIGPLPFTLTSFVPFASCYYAQVLAVDASNSELYAACSSSGEVGFYLYNVASVIHVGNTALCSSPDALAVNPNTVPPTVYAVCGYNNVVLNGSTVLLNNPSICSDPTDVVVNPTNGLVYVACYGNSVVLSILPNGTVTPITNAAQCQYPYDLTINPSNGVVYVACYYNGIVSITTNYYYPYSVSPVYAVANVLPFVFCQYARGVGVSSNYGTIYALCGNSGGNVPAPVLISIYPY